MAEPVDPAVAFEFFLKEVEDKHGALEAGRPVFKHVEHIRYTVPGANGRFTVNEYKVTDKHIERHKKQYEAWKRGEEVPLDGTSLNEFPMINQDMRKAFQMAGIRTIEALAVASEDLLRHVGPGSRDAQNKARAFIDTAKNSGAVAAKVVDQDKRIAAQDRTIAKLQNQVVELSKALERRGGDGKVRPPINEDEEEVMAGLQ